MSGRRLLIVCEKPSVASRINHALRQDEADRGHPHKGAICRSWQWLDFDGEEGWCKCTLVSTFGNLQKLVFDGPQFHQGKANNLPARECFAVNVKETSLNSEFLPWGAEFQDVLVLALDDDRAGERISQTVLQHLERIGTIPGKVVRVRLPALDRATILQALRCPDHLQEDVARSVKAQEEIDLRLGVAVSRLLQEKLRPRLQNLRQACKLPVPRLVEGQHVLSYGPCQFPALWFCAARHAAVVLHDPSPSWVVRLRVKLGKKRSSDKPSQLASPLVLQLQGVKPRCRADAERLAMESTAAAQHGLQVESASRKQHTLRRPVAMNSVAMMRLASEQLGLSPDEALHAAQQLYEVGCLSYPRTETSAYPESLDPMTLLNRLSELAHSGISELVEVATVASQLLADGRWEDPRKDGVSAGDHEPIVPVSSWLSDGGGQKSIQAHNSALAVFTLVCRHCLATLLPDSTCEELRISASAGSGLRFTAEEWYVLEGGWTQLGRRPGSWERPAGCSGKALPQATWQLDIHEGARLECSLQPRAELYLQPGPWFLTEADLMAKMEEYKIGTDCTMAEHVKKIVDRGYAHLDAGSRQLLPSFLGLSLIYGFSRAAPKLAEPRVRSRIEDLIREVAEGRLETERCVTLAVRSFRWHFDTLDLHLAEVECMLQGAVAQCPNWTRDVEDTSKFGAARLAWQQMTEHVAAEGLHHEPLAVRMEAIDRPLAVPRLNESSVVCPSRLQDECNLGSEICDWLVDQELLILKGCPPLCDEAQDFRVAFSASATYARLPGHSQEHCQWALNWVCQPGHPPTICDLQWAFDELWKIILSSTPAEQPGFSKIAVASQQRQQQQQQQQPQQPHTGTGTMETSQQIINDGIAEMALDPSQGTWENWADVPPQDRAAAPAAEETSSNEVGLPLRIGLGSQARANQRALFSNSPEHVDDEQEISFYLSPLLLAKLLEKPLVPTAIQKLAWPVLLMGQSVELLAAPGSGKTLAYLLPLAQHLLARGEAAEGDGPAAVVLCATDAYAEAALQEARSGLLSFGELGLRTMALDGQSCLDPLRQPAVPAALVFATPQRLLEAVRQKALHLDCCEHVVIDEADLMLATQSEQIQKICELAHRRQQLVLAASAACPEGLALASCSHRRLEVLPSCPHSQATPPDLQLNPAAADAESKAKAAAKFLREVLAIDNSWQSGSGWEDWQNGGGWENRPHGGGCNSKLPVPGCRTPPLPLAVVFYRVNASRIMKDTLQQELGEDLAARVVVTSDIAHPALHLQALVHFDAPSALGSEAVRAHRARRLKPTSSEEPRIASFAR
ncbi:unnamed protein product [Polarella glacialis]|uniref:DNA topoisomerase n=1 Tax=Polarella glacialis TaxID=89957 RepID=A0A813I8Y2_POLGL|nr:unnamed protein product [Polarella glacialis]